MKIKYGELPTIEFCKKLISVSFNSPKKNLEVYKFCKQIEGYLEYVENERIKLFKRYGEEDSETPGAYRIKAGTESMEHYQREWGEVLGMEIEDDINPLPLVESDFYNENCAYSNDKDMWLSAMDIGTAMRFCETLNG